MIHWVIHIVLLGILSLLFYRRFHADLPTWIYWTSLTLKLLAGIAVGLIFFHYYKMGDTILFFHEAVEISSLPLGEYLTTLFSPSTYATSNQPRVLFFTKFLSFFTLITGNSYWLSSMYLSIISFFATWYFVITAAKSMPANRPVIILSFLFLPTVVFWSSGILKDSLAFSALVFLVAIVVKRYFQHKIQLFDWLFAAVGLFLLFKVKHYLLISLILFIGILLFTNFMSMKSTKHRALAMVVAIVAFTATQFIHPYLRLERLNLTLYETNQAILAKSTDENKLSVVIDAPTFLAIAQATPIAMQTGLFRPSIFDHSTVWGWFHRIENTILALLFTMSIILLIRGRANVDIPIVFSGCLIIIILATLLALATPNFGTLVRYKNAFMPFIFLLCGILPYHHFTSKRAS